MPPATRILQSSSSQLPAADPPINLTMDSDVVLILASLLCALICIVGLAFAARCAWLRRSSREQPPSPTTSKGIKRKMLNSLPKSSFSAVSADGLKLTDCAICLSEFEDGEEIRILPQCGHGFHVGCIDTWLASHSSCPSCRQVLVVPASSTCRRCGAASSAAVAEVGGDSSFLP